MASRLTLQTMLEELLESNEVYYNSPESKRMAYPAIVYRRSKIDKKSADNKAYLLKPCYEITVIDTLPDNPVVEKLLALPYCTYETGYVSDGLHHDRLTLYY